MSIDVPLGAFAAGVSATVFAGTFASGAYFEESGKLTGALAGVGTAAGMAGIALSGGNLLVVGLASAVTAPNALMGALAGTQMYGNWKDNQAR